MGDPLQTEQIDHVAIDRVAILHRRRKSAMVSLLSQFERDIEPHLGPGHRQAINDFKRGCREKLNALTFEAVELMLRPDGEINEHAVDFAAEFGFPDHTE